MKRLLIVVLAVTMLVSGCVAPVGRQPLGTTSIPTVSESAAAPTLEPTEEPTPEPTPSPTPEPTQKPGEAVVGQKVFYVWKATSTIIEAYAACEITNVGESPIEIDDVTFSLLDKDGGVLDTMDAGIPIPDVLGPGQTAYVYAHSYPDTFNNPKDAVSIDITGAFSDTERMPVILDVTGAKYFMPKDKYSNYKVTGWIENNNADTADDVRVACAFYDANNTLLGVLIENVDAAIGPSGKAAFSASYPDLPHTITKKIASVKCIAFDWILG